MFQRFGPVAVQPVGFSRRRGNLALSPPTRRLDSNLLLKSRIDANGNSEHLVTCQLPLSDNEDSDLPITYGLVIHKLNEVPRKSEAAEELNSEASDPTIAHKRRPDCVRDRPLPPEEIDAYIERNKSKV
ncbi:hypothetical protein COOONC_00127 [Cooperia oncophora]